VHVSLQETTWRRKTSWAIDRERCSLTNTISVYRQSVSLGGNIQEGTVSATLLVPEELSGWNNCKRSLCCLIIVEYTLEHICYFMVKLCVAHFLNKPPLLLDKVMPQALPEKLSPQIFVCLQTNFICIGKNSPA
jgi:hypothetical protein